ncbi:hypothetical protein FIBSPDRAFT_855737 [Athelia psychrophila]|uniref:Uncharacterized protein n=1 Tax=Athelia psychrophila TaxID=1759441 RepID=A0A166NZR3_9AGAM|nr:hypothetical protein FIBSPDRAFT_855737 [Fibularhizoctonia sp. CBS 109695]
MGLGSTLASPSSRTQLVGDARIPPTTLGTAGFTVLQAAIDADLYIPGARAA